MAGEWQALRGVTDAFNRYVKQQREDRMSNMMPGDNRGAEPQEHDSRCASQCEYIEHTFDWEKGVDQLIALACWLTHLERGQPVPAGRADYYRRAADDVLTFIECPKGHRSHECNCDDWTGEP
jgi:hypothetical protein